MMHDFRTQERIKAVVAILNDYRRRRLRFALDNPNDGIPTSLSQEIEAEAILRELNLA